MGAKRLIFLGVLFSGPQFNTRGELVAENISLQRKISSFTPTMINLGYYVKASEILSFKTIIVDKGSKINLCPPNPNPNSKKH